jgi:hypothetical protein
MFEEFDTYESEESAKSSEGLVSSYRSETEIDCDGRSPFEIIADFNRQNQEKKLNYFNRPKITIKASAPVFDQLSYSPSPVVAIKPMLRLPLPAIDSIRKSLSELKSQRLAEQPRIARLEELLTQLQQEFSKSPMKD